MSERIADVVTGLVTRRGKNGRCSYSVEAKRALAELCSRPGVSVAKTALTHGINANLLRRWIVQFSGATRLSAVETPTRIPAAALVPVTTRMPRATRPPVSADSYIEITLPAAAVRVHGTVDAQVLGVVLDCLAQRA
jgi:transposase